MTPVLPRTTLPYPKGLVNRRDERHRRSRLSVEVDDGPERFWRQERRVGAEYHDRPCCSGNRLFRLQYGVPCAELFRLEHYLHTVFVHRAPYPVGLVPQHKDDFLRVRARGCFQHMLNEG
jgi:hypothetical protein